MFFISYAKPSRSKPKGVLTFDKSRRIIGISSAYSNRASSVILKYEQTPSGKKYAKECKKKADHISNMTGTDLTTNSKVYLNRLIRNFNQLELEYYKGLKEFSEFSNASHCMIKRIDEVIADRKKLLGEDKKF